MAIYTPGPWSVAPSEWNGGPEEAISVVDAAGTYIAQAWTDFEAEQPDAVPVKDIAPHGTGAANARLIAASPKMLAALKALLSNWDAHDNGERCGIVKCGECGEDIGWPSDSVEAPVCERCLVQAAISQAEGR